MPQPVWEEAGVDGMDMGCCHSCTASPAGTMPNLPGPMQGMGTEAQAGLGSTGSLLPEYPKEILEMGLR